MLILGPRLSRAVAACEMTSVVVLVCVSDAETVLKMMMMTGSAAVPLAALQAAGHRQRLQHAAGATYLTPAGLRHAAPLTAITPPTMYVHTDRETDRRTDRRTDVDVVVLTGARCKVVN